MLSTCPPRVTGAALAVSSCRRPGVAGTAVSVSYCLTARYCTGRFKLSTTRFYCNGASPLKQPTTPLQAGELPFSFSYEKKI